MLLAFLAYMTVHFSSSCHLVARDVSWLLEYNF
jgi:hypothetical protein